MALPLHHFNSMAKKINKLTISNKGKAEDMRIPTGGRSLQHCQWLPGAQGYLWTPCKGYLPGLDPRQGALCLQWHRHNGVHLDPKWPLGQGQEPRCTPTPPHQQPGPSEQLNTGHHLPQCLCQRVNNHLLRTPPLDRLNQGLNISVMFPCPFPVGEGH